MEQALQTLKQAVLQEWAKTTSQQPTTEEIQEAPHHLRTQRLGDHKAILEGGPRIDREDEREGEERRGEKERQRRRSSCPKQDRQQMRDFETLSQPMREEDKASR